MKILYQNGQSEELSFPPLSISERQKFRDCMIVSDTVAIVGLCTRRNPAWVDSLDPECFSDLAAAFFKANFKSVMDLADRDPITALKVAPIRMQLYLLLKQMEAAGTPLDLEPSTSSSPTSSNAAPQSNETPSAPPLAASAPATTTASAT
jgi:hypothetical protein